MMKVDSINRGDQQNPPPKKRIRPDEATSRNRTRERARNTDRRFFLFTTLAIVVALIVGALSFKADIERVSSQKTNSVSEGLTGLNEVGDKFRELLNTGSNLADDFSRTFAATSTEQNLQKSTLTDEQIETLIKNLDAASPEPTAAEELVSDE